MRTWRLVVVCCLVLCRPGLAAPGTEAYLLGLESLAQARYPAAVTSFSEALNAEPENPDYLLARAVALVFSEQFKPALQDLDRADRLRANHNDTRLWRASAVAMTGDFMNSSRLYPFAQHNKPYENAVRAMSHAYGEANFRKTMGDQLAVQQALPAQETARRQFPELARGFVERVKPQGAVSKTLRQRGIDRYNQGDYANAYPDLLAAYTADPNDIVLRYHLAGCRLATKAAEAARLDYTACLQAKPAWAFAALGRAYALAELGDEPGAQRDLARAQRLKPELDDKFAADVAKRLSRTRVTGAAEQQLEALLEAARQNAAWDQLLQNASRVIAAAQTNRLRADERYEIERSRLSLATWEKGATADAWAALGQYLFTEAFVVMGESVEPRVKMLPYRAHDEKSELADAEAALDRALQLDSNHAVALAFKGGCLLKRHQNWQAANQYLERALQRAPRDPRILELYAQVMDYAAYVQAVAAANLRSVDTWEDEYYVYYRYPSQAELKQAAELDRLAQDMWRRARGALEQAAAAQPNQPTAPYYRGVIAQRDRQYAQAAQHFQQATKLKPDYLEAWQRLSIVQAAQGQTRDAISAQSRATNLVHTSAASMLKLVWLDLPRTAYQSAGAGVAQALALDAADPRGVAYRGAIARAQENWREAAACFVAAAALERQRQALAGVAFDAPAVRYTAEQAARLIAYNTAAVEALLRTNQAQLAQFLLKTNFALHASTPADQRYQFTPWALVPAVPDDPNRLPDEPNIETNITWSALYAGRLHLAQRNYDAAMQQFQWAANHESRKPPTMDQGMAIRIPGLWAKLGLVDAALQQGNARLASQMMQNYGHPTIAPTAMREEADRLRNALETKGQRSGGDTYHDMLDRLRRQQR